MIEAILYTWRHWRGLSRFRALYWRFVRRHECEICECGRPVFVYWVTGDSLFNKVVGSPHAVLCIPCFDRQSTTKGFFLKWLPEIDAMDVPRKEHDG